MDSGRIYSIILISSLLIYVKYSLYVAGSLCDEFDNVVKTLTMAESKTIIGIIVCVLQIHCSNVVDTLTVAECWLGFNCEQSSGVQSRP